MELYSSELIMQYEYAAKTRGASPLSKVAVCS